MKIKTLEVIKFRNSNAKKFCKPDECVICLTNNASYILYCDCGNIPLCASCEKSLTTCPVCKSGKEIIRDFQI